MIFSIICPTLNEEQYIEKILRVFVEHCPQPSEIFIVDAGSNDNTRKIVSAWQNQHHNIYLIDNPERFVSHAFNKCFSSAKGKYLALLGAHTRYPINFFKIAFSELEANNSDVVGGPLKQIGKGSWGQAIAWCMSTKFGVGGTEFRVSKKRGFVDSVAFAFYKREIFDKVGLFDTSLKRNQDDEMHYRINAAGFRILMVPEMECEYYVRSKLKTLFNQYYEYGLHKPLVIQKVMSGFRLRHAIPAFFCIYLLGVPLFVFSGWYLFLIPLILYVLLLVSFSFSNDLPGSVKLRAFMVYPVLHISYGLGFIMGLFRLRTFK